jgi:hypothetical protein
MFHGGPTQNDADREGQAQVPNPAARANQLPTLPADRGQQVSATVKGMVALVQFAAAC